MPECVNRRARMLTVQFYTRPGCSLCDSALAVVKRIQKRVPFHLELVNIETDPALMARYGNRIPVVTSSATELASSFVDEKAMCAMLQKLAS